MRMAKLSVTYHNEGTDYYLISAPTNFRLMHVPGSLDEKVLVTIDDGKTYELGMPLDEALEELNAAMNYTKEVEDVESSAKALFEYWKKQYEEVWKSERK